MAGSPEPGSGWIRAGALLLVGCGLLFLGANLIVGLLYGAAFHLDPTSPFLFATGLHGLVALLFLGVGLLALRASVGAAFALGARHPYARHGAIVLAVFYGAVGLLPLALLVLYAMLRDDVREAFPAA